MKPAHSQVSLSPGDGPLSLDDARQSLGLWDDQSMDEHLEALLKSATEYVRQVWGGPLGDEAVTAYYPKFARRLELPGQSPRRANPGFITSSTALVQYVDEGGGVQTAVPSEYDVDGSGKYLVVWPKEVLLQTRLSDRVDNPVMVSFTNTGTAPEQERLRAAIRVTLTHLYKVGQGEDTMIPRNAVMSLLGQGYNVRVDERDHGTDNFHSAR